MGSNFRTLARGGEVVRLGDLIEVKHGFPFKGELMTDDLSGKPIVVSIGNFEYSGGFRFESTSVREYRGDFPAEFRLNPGDILLVMTCQTSGGEILGIPAHVPADGRIYLHNQRLGRVVLKRPEKASLAFLYWYFLTQTFNRELFATATGTKILHTSPGRIEAAKLLLPPLEQQNAIADILDTIQRKIALLRETNAALEAIAQAIFKSWFVDFDPTRAKAEGRDPEGVPPEVADLFPSEFEDSELGAIPKGWTVRAMYDIAKYINGASYKAFAPNSDGRGLPIIKIAELKAGISQQTAFSDLEMPAKYGINNGDILFSWSGNPETSIDTFVWSMGSAWLNQHIFKVIPLVESERSFVLMTLKHFKPVFTQIAGHKQTTGLGHVTVADLKRLLTTKPSEPILKVWNRIVEPILERIHNNDIQAQRFAELRDTLLPRLMSGKLRIQEIAEVSG